jgi:hypothetical protein
MSVGLSLAVVAVTGCTSDEVTQTGLNEEGPPMVRQVFMSERVMLEEDRFTTRVQLAFGDHPDIETETDDRQVTQAIVGQNEIRVVMDELLVGNNLEEIGCADGTFSRVPRDANPDDIADCSPPNLQNCTAVCQGPPVVGIIDENEDGASDNRRMIDYGTAELGVQVICDGVNIPMDPVQSFYQPSGNQQITAGPLGIKSLGPAIVLIPISGIRTGATCDITFRDEVVDKDGERVCAPANGDITQACTTPGVPVQFGTQALEITSTDPVADQTGVAVSDNGSNDKSILVQFNTLIDSASVGAFSLTENGVDKTGDVTVMISDTSTVLTLVVAGGLAADSDYVLTVDTTLTDRFGGPLPQNTTLSFTTGMGSGVDAGVDAAL